MGRCVGSRCADVGEDAPTLPIVVSTCAMDIGSTDWLNCYDDSVQGYGTCFSSGCRARCVEQADCAWADAVAAADVRPHVCAHPAEVDGARSALGICVPQGELLNATTDCAALAGELCQTLPRSHGHRSALCVDTEELACD